MADIANNILDAIDLMVTKKLESLKFDKTAVCTVLDDSEANHGKYYVTDGYTEFFVYSDSTIYKRGNIVNVNIPNGDYSQTKYILGLHLSVNNNGDTNLINVQEQAVNQVLDAKITINNNTKSLKDWIIFLVNK